MKLITVGLMAVLLSCTTAPKPNPAGANVPGEFRYTKLRSNMVSLDYLAEPGTPKLEAKQLAGKHVASLCLSSGYRYFTVLDSSVSLIGTSGYADAGSDPAGRVARVIGNVSFSRTQPSGDPLNIFDARAVEEILSAF